jgi:hypothetical protein
MLAHGPSLPFRRSRVPTCSHRGSVCRARERHTDYVTMEFRPGESYPLRTCSWLSPVRHLRRGGEGNDLQLSRGVDEPTTRSRTLLVFRFSFSTSLAAVASKAAVRRSGFPNLNPEAHTPCNTAFHNLKPNNRNPLFHDHRQIYPSHPRIHTTTSSHMIGFCTVVISKISTTRSTKRTNGWERARR